VFQVSEALTLLGKVLETKFAGHPWSSGQVRSCLELHPGALQSSGVLGESLKLWSLSHSGSNLAISKYVLGGEHLHFKPSRFVSESAWQPRRELALHHRMGSKHYNS